VRLNEGQHRALTFQSNFERMNNWHSQLEFPVIAFSRSGWWKEAATPADLCDASHDDPLDDWQGLQIYDSAGRGFTAVRAFREWPRTLLGRWLCRCIDNCVRVGFDLSAPQPVSVQELWERVNAVESLPDRLAASSHRQILEHLCL